MPVFTYCSLITLSYSNMRRQLIHNLKHRGKSCISSVLQNWHSYSMKSMEVHEQVSSVILLLFIMDPKVLGSNQADCFLQVVPSASTSCWRIWKSQEDDRRSCCHRYWRDHSLWSRNWCVRSSASATLNQNGKPVAFFSNSSRQWTEACIHREGSPGHNRSGEALETLHPENWPEIGVLHVWQAAQGKGKEREVPVLETRTLLLQFWYRLSPRQR